MPNYYISDPIAECGFINFIKSEWFAVISMEVII